MSLIKQKKEQDIKYEDEFFKFRGVWFKKTTDGHFTGAHQLTKTEEKELKSLINIKIY